MSSKKSDKLFDCLVKSAPRNNTYAGKRTAITRTKIKR